MAPQWLQADLPPAAGWSLEEADLLLDLLQIEACAGTGADPAEPYLL